MAIRFPEYYAFYLRQAREQRGSGLPNFYKGSRYPTPFISGGNLFLRILPFLKKAISFAKSNTGRKILKSAKNIGSEVISNIQQNQNIKDSVKQALKSEGKQLLSHGLEKLNQQLNNKRSIEEDSEDITGAGFLSYSPLKKPKVNLLPNKRFKTDRRVQQIMKALKLKSKVPVFKRKTKRRKKRGAQSSPRSSKGKTASKKKRRSRKKKQRSGKNKINFPGLNF